MNLTDNSKLKALFRKEGNINILHILNPNIFFIYDTKKKQLRNDSIIGFFMLSIQVASIAKTPSDLSKAPIIPKQFR